MYSKILVPVDLAHLDKIEKAIAVAADLANHYGASVHLVGVTATTPGSVAHNPDEFQDKLGALAVSRSKKYGADLTPKMVINNDPAVELDSALEETARELGTDLVVMASHVPGFMDHIFHSNAGYLASHTSISVFVVRQAGET